jgi:hypothetical protein
MAVASISVSETPLVLYALRRADDALILGHRLTDLILRSLRSKRLEGWRQRTELAAILRDARKGRAPSVSARALIRG